MPANRRKVRTGSFSHRRVAVAVVVLIALAQFCTRARADGVYIPDRAYPTLPSIPAQSAIIVQRGNTETLIVESAFKTDSPNVAWILPLPAPPTKLDLADPGIITSATFALRPQISHNFHVLDSFTWLLLFLALPPALIIAFVRNPQRRRRALRTVLILDVVLTCLWSIMLPSLGKSGSGPIEGVAVSVLSTQRLGNADFTVLSATNPTALDQWLTDQSLQPLTPSAQSIVADYIAHGWCFVVGKLHPGSTELHLPQPLIATFPSLSPVFPMKLTALANSTNHVELCIIASQQATAAGFHCVVADEFNLEPLEQGANGIGTTQSAYFYAHDNQIRLGNPDLTALLWDSCIVTKLTADLPPTAMVNDVDLALVPLSVHRDWAFSTLARGQIFLAILVSGFIFFLISAAIVGRGGRKPSKAGARFLAALIGFVVLAALLVWVLLPTVPVRAVSFRARITQPRLLKTAQAMAAEGTLTPDMTHAQLAALPQFMIDHGLCAKEAVTNPYTGELMRPERSPGNFAIRLINGQPQFCIYDADGVENYTALIPTK